MLLNSNNIRREFKTNLFPGPWSRILPNSLPMVHTRGYGCVNFVAPSQRTLTGSSNSQRHKARKNSKPTNPQKPWFSAAATHFSPNPQSSPSHFLPPPRPHSPFPLSAAPQPPLPSQTLRPTPMTPSATAAAGPTRSGFLTSPRGRPRTPRETTTCTGWAKRLITWTSPSVPGPASSTTSSSESFSAETPISCLIIGRRSPGPSSTFRAIITLRLCSWYDHVLLASDYLVCIWFNRNWSNGPLKLPSKLNGLKGQKMDSSYGLGQKD